MTAPFAAGEDDFSPDKVNNLHRYSDNDTSPVAQHHTLGLDQNQASPGNHTHDGRNSQTLPGTGHTHTGLVIPDAAWRTIGAAGEPAYTSPHTAYSDPDYGSAQFRKLSEGAVIMRGIITLGTAPAQTSMFTLPVGYRPVRSHILPTTANDLFATMRIFPNGTVNCWAGAGVVAGAWFSIHSIFYPEQ